MAFDYTVEGNFKAIQKIYNIDPYFYMAVFYLGQFSGSIILSEEQGIFDISKQIITPSIVLLDDPYPIIQCRKRIFSGQNRIEISYGIFAILGMMGEFEKTLDKILGDERVQKNISLEDIMEADIDNLICCVRDALNYLERSYNVFPETVPPIPQMSLSSDILSDSLKFIIGHEMSHYLDLYYNSDFREKQQKEVLDNCFELLKSMKKTPYKKYVDKLLGNIERYVEQEQVFTIWSEEVLADYEGYQYLCRHAPVGYVGKRKIMAMTMAFLAMRVQEYFEDAWRTDIQKAFSIPIKWRETFLQSILYQRHYQNYDTFAEFIGNEWGIYIAMNLLFERVMSAIKSEEGKDGKKEEDEENRDFLAELHRCGELMEKMAATPCSELENVYQEIENIYNKGSISEKFREAFCPEIWAEILFQIGLVYYEQKNYDEAYKWLYRATTYFDASTEAQNSAAECYYRLGIVCYDMGWYREALVWYNEAISIKQSLPDFSFENNMEIYVSFASALIGDGRYEEAKKYVKDIFDWTADKNIKAEMLRDMGILCEKQGDNEKALEYFSDALALKENIFGPEHLEVAILYNSIGIVLYNMDQFDAAETYLMKAFMIKKSKLDPNDVSVTNTLHNLGMMEAKRGDGQKALEWFQNALDIRLETLGERHPLFADTLHSIGGVYYKMGMYDKALSYFEQALDIYQNVLGGHHPQTKMMEHIVDVCSKGCKMSFSTEEKNKKENIVYREEQRQ